MNNVKKVALAVLISLPAAALAQSFKDQIVGAWKTVEIYNTYVSWLSKPDRPKFGTANRLKGTDAERGVRRHVLCETGASEVGRHQS